MKRRTVLRSLMSLPAALAVPVEAVSQEKQEKSAVREKGVPAGPPVTAPGESETPLTPVADADTAAAMLVKTFSADEFSALVRLSELVAPARQNIPGAQEGEVAEFLDFLIGQSPHDTAALYRHGLEQLNAKAQEKYGKPFDQVSTEEAKPLLTVLDRPWEFVDSGEPLEKFLRTARGDIIKATLNSRSYIRAVSRTRRSRGGSGFYWYPMQ